MFCEDIWFGEDKGAAPGLASSPRPGSRVLREAVTILTEAALLWAAVKVNPVNLGNEVGVLMELISQIQHPLHQHSPRHQ